MLDLFCSLNGCTLLADGLDRFRSLGSGLRQKEVDPRSAEFVQGLLVMLGIVLAIWILQRLLTRNELVRRHHSPRALFRQLCYAHGLDRRSRRLLASLARERKLAQPARLFLEPDQFAAAGLGPKLESQAERLKELKERLFAEDKLISTAGLG